MTDGLGFARIPERSGLGQQRAGEDTVGDI